MLDGPFAYALLLGMVATVNPCGFALLPAYLAAFVGLDDSAGQRGWLARWGVAGRALAVAAVLTSGFVTVFGLFGVVVSKLIEDTSEVLPWVTIVVGVAMVALGIYLLTGRSLVFSIPKLQRGGNDGTYRSMYLFGVSYALASLSCTIGVFLGATTVAFNEGSYASTLVVFVVYALGMGVTVGVLTVAVALARAGIVGRFRSLLPVINRVAGAMLVVAGAYAAYYGWYEWRVYNDPDAGRDPVVDRALSVRDSMVGLFPDQDAAVWWTVIVGVAMAAFAAWGWWRRPGATGTRSGTARGS